MEGKTGDVEMDDLFIQSEERRIECLGLASLQSDIYHLVCFALILFYSILSYSPQLGWRVVLYIHVVSLFV